MVVTREDGEATVSSVVTVRSDASAFAIEASLDVRWNDTPIGVRNWTIHVPRGSLPKQGA